MGRKGKALIPDLPPVADNPPSAIIAGFAADAGSEIARSGEVGEKRSGKRERKKLEKDEDIELVIQEFRHLIAEEVRTIIPPGGMTPKGKEWLEVADFIERSGVWADYEG